MNPHSRPPATDTANLPPARKLAADVRVALDLLRRGQREVAEVAKGPPENIGLLLVTDDLGVTVADLDLVARDLERLAR